MLHDTGVHISWALNATHEDIDENNKCGSATLHILAMSCLPCCTAQAKQKQVHAVL